MPIHNSSQLINKTFAFIVKYMYEREKTALITTLKMAENGERIYFFYVVRLVVWDTSLHVVATLREMLARNFTSIWDLPVIVIDVVTQNSMYIVKCANLIFPLSNVNLSDDGTLVKYFILDVERNIFPLIFIVVD